MTKMAAMPIYGKNISKYFYMNWQADFHETLYMYVALGTPAHYSLFNGDNGVTVN